MEKINFTNGQAPAINETNLNQLQSNVENAINENTSKLNQLTDLLGVEIEVGNFEVTTTGTSLTTQAVNFKKEFSGVPTIFLSIRGSAGYSTKYGSSGRTTTGFTAQVVHTGAFTVYYSYLAVYIP